MAALLEVEMLFFVSFPLQVVGGAQHGGVLVRRGFELTAELEESRLETGAVVKAWVSEVAFLLPGIGESGWAYPL